MKGEVNMENNIDKKTENKQIATRAPKSDFVYLFESRQVYLWTLEKWATINQRTINGAYANSRSSARNPQQISYLKKNIRLEMSKEEFFNFFAAQEFTILEMMNNYLRPSIDRIDNEKGYSADNIQIIPLIDNIVKDRESANPKNMSVLTCQLKNRLQYLKGQNYDVIYSLVVDYYFKLLKNYRFATSTIEYLINEGYISDPFAKASDLTVYADESIAKVNEAIKEYEDTQAAKLAYKESILKMKANRLSKQQNELLNKQTRLAIVDSPRYKDVYEFVRLRKQTMKSQLSRGHKPTKICNLDDRIISEKTKNLAIEIVANDIPLVVNSVKEARAEQPKPTHRNISWDSVACLYIAEFTKNKIKHFVGRYETEAEAVTALITAKTKLEGERA